MLGAAFECDEGLLSGTKDEKQKGNKTFDNPEGLLQVGYPFLKKKYPPKQSFLKRIFFPNNKQENLIRTYSFDTEHAERLLLSLKK